MVLVDLGSGSGRWKMTVTSHSPLISLTTESPFSERSWFPQLDGDVRAASRALALGSCVLMPRCVTNSGEKAAP